MKYALLLLQISAVTACVSNAPPSPLSPAQEAAYVAGKLNILATKCTAYVGSIKDLAAVQKAIAKQETLSLSLGGTQDTIDEGSHKAYIENGGGAAWRGQAEECVQLANEVAKYF